MSDSTGYDDLLSEMTRTMERQRKLLDEQSELVTKLLMREKPTVSDKKIEDMASQIACMDPDVALPNLIPIVRNIAKELGMEVVDG